MADLRCFLRKNDLCSLGVNFFGDSSVGSCFRRRRIPGLEGPGVNEVSFRARPHHRVHRTLGVDARATGPRWRVDSIEGSEVGGGGKRVEKGGGEKEDISNKKPYV
jgi:hypothetical protein